MSNEIELYKRIPDPVAGIVKLGESLARSRLLGFTRDGQGVALAWECFATGQSPFAVMRRIHITPDGRFLMRSDAMLAGYRERGGKVKWVKRGTDEVVGEWEFEGQKTVIGYHIDTAKAAGYVKPSSGWVKDPEAQLQAACIRKAMRALAPEVIVECGDSGEEFPVETGPTLDLVKPTLVVDTEKSVSADARIKGEVHEVTTTETPHNKATETQDDKATDSDVESVSESVSPTPVGPDEFPMNRRPGRISSPISDETLLKLEKSIGAYADASLVFLRSNLTPDGGPWIGPSEGFHHLSEKDAQRILSNVSGFLKRVNAAGK